MILDIREHIAPHYGLHVMAHLALHRSQGPRVRPLCRAPALPYSLTPACRLGSANLAPKVEQPHYSSHRSTDIQGDIHPQGSIPLP